MARLFQTGAELGHIHAEGITTTGTGTLTFDTTTKRTGTRSFKYDGTASNLQVMSRYAFTGAVGTTYYACLHVLIPAATGFPSVAKEIVTVMTSGLSILLRVRVTPTGAVQLINSAAAQVGSDSADTLTLDAWSRLDVVILVNASTNDDTLALYLDGTLVASSTTQSVGVTAPGVLQWGWVGTPDANKVIYVDDVALNNSTGTVNNGVIGDQKVYALLPTADGVLGNFTAGDGTTTTNLWNAIDNVPPAGEAPAGTTILSEVENAVSAAGSNYNATMQTYTAAGIGASDLVTAIIPVVEIGSSSTTGSDTLGFEVVTNPVIGITNSSCDISSGVYPASWNYFPGIVSENPTVTKGSAPTMRLTKNVSTTRINSCCLMAMLVAVQPAPPATFTPIDRDLRQHAAYRM